MSDENKAICLLKNQVAQAINAVTEKEFFESVANCLFTIRGLEQFPHLQAFWNKHKKKHYQDLLQLGQKGGEEINHAFSSLKNDLAQIDMTKNPMMSVHIGRELYDIEKILKDGVSCNDDLYLRNAYQRMQFFLGTLLSLGVNHEMISKYAIIYQSHIPMVNPFTGVHETSEWCVKESAFAKSLHEKYRLEFLFQAGSIKDLWIALDLLFSVERCWTMEDGAILNSNDTSLYDPRELLHLRVCYTELEGIKTKKSTNIERQRFFTRTKLTSCLNLVKSKIINDEEDVSEFKNVVIELIFEKGCLLIEVKSLLLEVKSYKIHCCKHESSILKVTEHIFASPGKWIDVRVVGGSDGIKDAAKFRNRIKINNSGIEDSFFESSGTKIRLKTTSVHGQALSSNERKQFKQFLSTLSRA